MNRISLLAPLAWIGLASMVVAPASAQDADPLPTLDELLGTEGGASEGGDAIVLPDGAGPGETELDRLLSGQEIVDEFRSAVDLMSRSAQRLSGSQDTGLTTQRMQEDVLRALDKLIADAQQRGQQSSSSSSSSADQQQEGQQQPG